MCLIMFKENKDGVFSNRHFKSMISRNKNGLGIMYIDENNRVQVERTVGTDKQKFQLWQKHKHRDSYAMHARLTTHGLTNLENCHPYKILSIDDGDARDLYMMHNGVLRDAPETDKTMSDTWHFVEYILKPIAKTNIELLWVNEEFQQWLQSTIKGSKLLFMRSPEEDVENNVLILNASEGKEVDNCWLSNTYSTTETYTHYVNHGGNAANKAPFTTATATTDATMGTTKPLSLADQFAKAYKKEHEYKDEAKAKGISYSNYADEKEWLQLLLDDEKEKAEKRKLEEKSNIILFPLTQDKVEECQQLLPLLGVLNGLTPHSVKEWIIDNKEDATDIIIAFHKENTMSYETLMSKIRTREDIDSIVDTIRHIASVQSPRTFATT